MNAKILMLDIKEGKKEFVLKFDIDDYLFEVYKDAHCYHVAYNKTVIYKALINFNNINNIISKCTNQIRIKGFDFVATLVSNQRLKLLEKKEAKKRSEESYYYDDFVENIEGIKYDFHGRSKRLTLIHEKSKLILTTISYKGHKQNALNTINSILQGLNWNLPESELNNIYTYRNKIQVLELTFDRN